ASRRTCGWPTTGSPKRFRGSRNIGGPPGSRQRRRRRATGRRGFISSGDRPIGPPDASVWREQVTRNGPWPARAARAAVLVSMLGAPGGVHGQESSRRGPAASGQEACSPGPISSGQEPSAPGASTSGQEASAPGPIRGLQEASAPGPVPSEPEAADAFVPPTLAPIPLPEPSTVAATPPAAPAPAPSTVRLALPALDRAWREPAADLLTRADRVRAAADALGIVDVEPVARALLLAGGGSPLERARAAVRVAP